MYPLGTIFFFLGDISLNNHSLEVMLNVCIIELKTQVLRVPAILLFQTKDLCKEATKNLKSCERSIFLWKRNYILVLKHPMTYIMQTHFEIEFILISKSVDCYGATWRDLVTELLAWMIPDDSDNLVQGRRHGGGWGGGFDGCVRTLPRTAKVRLI